MNELARLKQRLRRRSEHALRVEAMRTLARGQPATTAAYPSGGGLFWRFVFVPLYRRLPWTFKQRAMRALRMTATGWSPPPRQPGRPWRPPAQRPRP